MERRGRRTEGSGVMGKARRRRKRRTRKRTRRRTMRMMRKRTGRKTRRRTKNLGGATICVCFFLIVWHIV